MMDKVEDIQVDLGEARGAAALSLILGEWGEEGQECLA